MINLDLNIETKEWLLYGALGGVFTLIVWSVYAQGISSGYAEAELKMSSTIVDLQDKLTRQEELTRQAGIDLGECHAARAGKAVLDCEEVCRERVSKAIEGVKELCSKR